jgi:hypothetical protein
LGGNIKTLVNKPPFATNGTGTADADGEARPRGCVEGLVDPCDQLVVQRSRQTTDDQPERRQIDGIDSSALLTLTAAAQTYLTKADANSTFEIKASAASSFAPINVAPYAVVTGRRASSRTATSTTATRP